MEIAKIFFGTDQYEFVISLSDGKFIVAVYTNQQQLLRGCVDSVVIGGLPLLIRTCQNEIQEVSSSADQ